MIVAAFVQYISSIPFWENVVLQYILMRIKKPLPAIAAAVKLPFLSVVANFYALPFFVAPPGFEPRQTEPKSVVLPLYYGAAFVWDGKIRLFFLTSKKTSYFFYPHRINHLDNSSFTFSTTFSGPNHSIQA